MSESVRALHRDSEGLAYSVSSGRDIVGRLTVDKIHRWTDGCFGKGTSVGIAGSTVSHKCPIACAIDTNSLRQSSRDQSCFGSRAGTSSWKKGTPQSKYFDLDRGEPEADDGWRQVPTTSHELPLAWAVLYVKDFWTHVLYVYGTAHSLNVSSCQTAHLLTQSHDRLVRSMKRPFDRKKTDRTAQCGSCRS